MAELSVVAIYETFDEAENAVRKLDDNDFPMKRVSIIAQDLQSEREVQGYVNAGDGAGAGAATGAWVGGLFGLLTGAAFIWVPGFGPVLAAGSIATALLGTVEGAAIGAAGGGALGALIGWGVSKQEIIKYETALKGGKYLVIANGGPDEVTNARQVLANTNAESVTAHLEEQVATS